VALTKRRLRLLLALIEVRAYFRYGDKERLRLLTQELEVLPPDDEVNWKLIPLTFSFWLALAQQQDSALLVEKLRAARQWINKAGDPLATFRVMTYATGALSAPGSGGQRDPRRATRGGKHHCGHFHFPVLRVALAGGF
jgi:hypothetical protein